MLTFTVNTFENIDTEFHNDPRKTLGDMYIYFRGGLTFVALFRNLYIDIFTLKLKYNLQRRRH